MAIRPILERYRMIGVWHNGLASDFDRSAWRTLCHNRVRALDRTEFEAALHHHSSLQFYSNLKQHPHCESYLSSANREGRMLKLHARAGTLPLLNRLASLCKADPLHHSRHCLMCKSISTPTPTPVPTTTTTTTTTATTSTENETLAHFILHCPAPRIHKRRSDLFERLRASLLPLNSAARVWFDGASDNERLVFLLGGDMRRIAPSLATKRVSAMVDRHVQNFLLLAWRDRTLICNGVHNLASVYSSDGTKSTQIALKPLAVGRAAERRRNRTHTTARARASA